MSPLDRMKPGWAKAMADVIGSPDYKSLGDKIRRQMASGEQIQPSDPKVWLRVFGELDLDQVKVCIIGPEPYAIPGISNGLAFAVNDWVPVPPLLHNIFREVERITSCNMINRSRGTLSGWVEQGVMLLNMTMTVATDLPTSHKDLGWGIVAKQAIRALDQRKDPVAFVNWSDDPLALGGVDRMRHLVLNGVCPSPRNLRKFLGNGHLIEVNDFLYKQANSSPIGWTRTVGLNEEEF